MKLSDIFNAELSTVGEWIAQGFRWWLAELAGMLPSGLRSAGGRARSLVLPPDETTPGWRQLGPAGEAPLSRAQARNAIVALPESRVLTHALALPSLPDADLRRLVALDIDRLTPFANDQVWIDVEQGQAQAGGRGSATLAILPRNDAARVLAEAEAAGISVRRLGLRSGNGIRFDFMRAIGGARGLSIVARWWIAVGALFAVNIAALAIRDAAAVSRMREAVELAAPSARVATALRNRVTAEQARRERLVRLRAAHDPMPVLQRVQAALPGSAWVQRLVWNGRTVRLVGYQPQGIDVVAALRRAPGFARVRTSTSDIAPDAGQARPFDVTADVRPGVRP